MLLSGLRYGAVTIGRRCWHSWSSRVVLCTLLRCEPSIAPERCYDGAGAALPSTAARDELRVNGRSEALLEAVRTGVFAEPPE